jgi:flagellar basal body-associated protein FliL
MELGPTEQAGEAAPIPPAQEQPAPTPEANSGQELNIPPEIAAAKANIQNAVNPQMQAGQAAAAMPKKSPLILIIIIVAAVLVLAGGYFAYGYFTKDKGGSTSDQYFISE